MWKTVSSTIKILKSQLYADTQAMIKKTHTHTFPQNSGLQILFFSLFQAVIGTLQFVQYFVYKDFMYHGKELSVVRFHVSQY